MTRKRAIEILKAGLANGTIYANHEYGARALLDALDRAGAFPSEATEAEISRLALAILDEGPEAGTRALQLATACRAAGLVR